MSSSPPTTTTTTTTTTSSPSMMIHSAALMNPNVTAAAFGRVGEPLLNQQPPSQLSPQAAAMTLLQSQLALQYYQQMLATATASSLQVAEAATTGPLAEKRPRGGLATTFPPTSGVMIPTVAASLYGQQSTIMSTTASASAAAMFAAGTFGHLGAGGGGTGGSNRYGILDIPTAGPTTLPASQSAFGRGLTETEMLISAADSRQELPTAGGLGIGGDLVDFDGGSVMMGIFGGDHHHMAARRMFGSVQIPTTTAVIDDVPPRLHPMHYNPTPLSQQHLDSAAPATSMLGRESIGGEVGRQSSFPQIPIPITTGVGIMEAVNRRQSAPHVQLSSKEMHLRRPVVGPPKPLHRTVGGSAAGSRSRLPIVPSVPPAEQIKPSLNTREAITDHIDRLINQNDALMEATMPVPSKRRAKPQMLSQRSASLADSGITANQARQQVGQPPSKMKRPSLPVAVVYNMTSSATSVTTTAATPFALTSPIEFNRRLLLQQAAANLQQSTGRSEGLDPSTTSPSSFHFHRTVSASNAPYGSAAGAVPVLQSIKERGGSNPYLIPAQQHKIGPSLSPIPESRSPCSLSPVPQLPPAHHHFLPQSARSLSPKTGDSLLSTESPIREVRSGSTSSTTIVIPKAKYPESITSGATKSPVLQESSACSKSPVIIVQSAAEPKEKESSNVSPVPSIPASSIVSGSAIPTSKTAEHKQQKQQHPLKKRILAEAATKQEIVMDEPSPSKIPRFDTETSASSLFKGEAIKKERVEPEEEHVIAVDDRNAFFGQRNTSISSNMQQYSHDSIKTVQALTSRQYLPSGAILQTNPPGAWRPRAATTSCVSRPTFICAQKSARPSPIATSDPKFSAYLGCDIDLYAEARPGFTPVERQASFLWMNECSRSKPGNRPEWTYTSATTKDTAGTKLTHSSSWSRQSSGKKEQQPEENLSFPDTSSAAASNLSSSISVSSTEPFRSSVAVFHSALSETSSRTTPPPPLRRQKNLLPSSTKKPSLATNIDRQETPGPSTVIIPRCSFSQEATQSMDPKNSKPSSMSETRCGEQSQSVMNQRSIPTCQVSDQSSKLMFRSGASGSSLSSFRSATSAFDTIQEQRKREDRFEKINGEGKRCVKRIISKAAAPASSPQPPKPQRQHLRKRKLPFTLIQM